MAFKRFGYLVFCLPCMDLLVAQWVASFFFFLGGETFPTAALASNDCQPWGETF